MLPWIRRYNYIQDYFYTTYRLYVELYHAYPVTYYSLDFENSIVDDEHLLAMNYEKLGVGELSGVKWKKIKLLPVFGVEQIQPAQSSGDNKGMTYYESMNSAISFPSIYGLKPVEWDVVDLNLGFKTSSIKISPLFVVTNINLAHQSDYFNIYQCRLSVAPFNLTMLEKQISSYYTFLEHEKRIFPDEISDRLLDIQGRFEKVSENLINLFNNRIGIFQVTEE
jgi:hypothetical protein